MKKFVLFIVVLSVCLFSSCASPQTEYVYINENSEDGEAYYEGFDDGYSEGYDEGFSDGYNFGAEDSFNDHGDSFLYRAEQYAAENSNWHPVEAWDLISRYQNGEAFYSDGSLPSEQDYSDAIDSLICFYDYFCSQKYK